MKNINITRESLTWILMLIPFAYIAYVWGQLPNRIPTHFDIHGTANGWGGRSAIFLLPGINIATYLIIIFLPLIDPKRMNTDELNSMFTKVRMALAFFLSLLSIVVTYISVNGSGPEIAKWIPIGCLLLIAVLGNFMINIKPNWFIGIRTPWTLSSDIVWKKTHQVVGRIWFYGGLLCAALVYFTFGKGTEYIILTFVLGSAAFAFAYSFWLYKKEKEQEAKA